MRYAERARRRSLAVRQVRVTAAVTLLATAMVACGGSGGGGGGGDDAAGGGKAAPASVPELSSDPLTLSFIWFEWPPAQALEDFANAEYKKERPNVTVRVLPFSAGLPPVTSGSFAVLDSPVRPGADVVYLENKTRIFFLDGDDEVQRYELAFDHIAGMALSVEDSRAVLDQALARS